MKIRVIPTKLHGALDYVTAPALAVAPDVLRLNGMRSSSLVPRTIGTGGGVVAALTDYELGVKMVIPMRAHLVVDAVSGAALASAPWLFGSARQGARHWLPHAVVGVTELALALTTKTEKRRAAGLRSALRPARLQSALRQALTPKTTAAILGGVAVAGGLAYVIKRRGWDAAAVIAEAVEEVADTVEDAAEDLGDAARSRADGGSAS
jgi:hypothetical protein